MNNNRGKYLPSTILIISNEHIFVLFLGSLGVSGLVLRIADMLLRLFCILNIPEFFIYRAIYTHQMR